MHHLVRKYPIVARAVTLGTLSVLWGQFAMAQVAPTPACALLSAAEIRTITGLANYPDFVDGDPEGEGAGGGSSCQYGGSTVMPGDDAPLVSVVLIRGKNWTEQSRSFALAPGCQRESVDGLGDDAFFESCSASRSQRTPPLYVKVATNDLIVQMDVKAPATQTSVRQTVIAIARAAAEKLR